MRFPRVKLRIFENFKNEKLLDLVIVFFVNFRFSFPETEKREFFFWHEEVKQLLFSLRASGASFTDLSFQNVITTKQSSSIVPIL